MKVCSLSFCAVAVPSLGRSSFIWQPAGAPTSLTGLSLAIWKSMKKERSNTSSTSCLGLTGFFSGKVKCRVSTVSL